MAITYRVPSIHEYVELKSKQLNLAHQQHIWQRKVEIAERELHLCQNQFNKYPERIIHPWKYLQNPSAILFSQQTKASLKPISRMKSTLINISQIRSISNLKTSD